MYKNSRVGEPSPRRRFDGRRGRGLPGILDRAGITSTRPGPRDPGLIKKCLEARAHGDHPIVVWGDGSPTREFLYIEDAAEGIVLAGERYNDSEPVNLGSAFEISIKDLVSTIARQTGFAGEIGLGYPASPMASRAASWTSAGPKATFGFKSHTTFEDGPAPHH